MYTVCFEAYPSFISTNNEKKILKRLAKRPDIEQLCLNSSNNMALGILNEYEPEITPEVIRECINKISYETDENCYISLKEGEKYKCFVCCGTIVESRRTLAIISATSLESAKRKLNRKGIIGFTKEVEMI